MRIAIDARLKNGVLMEFVEKVGSGARAAELLGIRADEFSGWLNFRAMPGWRRLEKDGDGITSTISAALGRTVEVYDVWPYELYRAVTGNMIPRRTIAYREVDAIQLSAVDARALPPVYVDVESDDPALRIDTLLSKANLSDKQRVVLTARFGLDSGEAKSFSDISAEMGVSSGRVQQVEAAALRRLRTAAKKLGWGAS